MRRDTHLMRAMIAGLAIGLGSACHAQTTGSGADLVRLRYAQFDPAMGEPSVPAGLRARADAQLWLVHAAGTPTSQLRHSIAASGGSIERFLTDNTYIVRIPPDRLPRISEREDVRWVGAFHPAYRIDPALLAGLHNEPPTDAAVYSIEAGQRGAAAQSRIAAHVDHLGGRIVRMTGGFRLEASLTPPQVLALAHSDDVHYIDRPGNTGADMDLARQLLGAAPLLSTAGFTGQGVRGEVLDAGLDLSHPAYQSPPPLIHCPGTNPPAPDHGTGVYGIIFSTGAGNAAATGMLPDAGQGIFCYATSPGDPHQRISELIDPNGPYRAVFQARAIGSAFTPTYTTISAEMDALFFQFDLLAGQSHGNTTVGARPEAWAKNVLSVGAIQHQNTLTRDDDTGSAYMPPFDNRIKPDLVGLGDGILTTGSGGQFITFGGTSAATAMVTGAAGLIFQMWHEGVWAGHGGGSSVFDSRPSHAAARALLIHSTFQYDWTAGGPNASIVRRAQGWGMPDLESLYLRRDKTFIEDQAIPLHNQQTATYQFSVAPGESVLRATMVYLDPAGSPAAAQARVNDLTLRVTSPQQTVYWGNAGLTAGPWSQPGGAPDTVNVVENVIIPAPEPGTWTVEVIASQVVQDAWPATPETDAAFALVVSGVVVGPPACYANCDGSSTAPVLNIADFACFLQRFAAGDNYANCDGSTVPPVLNIADFACFLQAFAAGCP
jgi:serine protease AprX